jgi:TatD DNase family protein
MFFDTHAHLYSEQFKEDQDAMIQRAISAGVERFYLPNIDLESIDGMLDLEKKYPEACFPMMGLHPCSVEANWEEVLTKMKTLIVERKFVAIGEIGIDLYWDKTYEEEQKKAFRLQINWAKELGLPIVIHARDSFEQIFEIIDEENDERLRGIFHCFTGGQTEIEKILSYGGFSFGIGGVVTYKKSTLPEVLTLIPLNKLVLETDSPYLPPTPHRGKRNESAFIVHTAEKVAEIYGITLLELGKITSQNTLNLFH